MESTCSDKFAITVNTVTAPLRCDSTLNGIGVLFLTNQRKDEKVAAQGILYKPVFAPRHHRGKFDVGIFEDRMVLMTPKLEVVLPFASIQAVAILDDLPKDTKGRVLLYLHLDR